MYATDIALIIHKTNFKEFSSIQGQVGRTVKNVTRKECTVYCTLHLGCKFFNHKMDGSECELITDYSGKIVSKVGWQLVQTSYADPMRQGNLTLNFVSCTLFL